MKGYGLTVVSGEAIEKFGVEVLGVVPNSAPGRASIVVRVSGLGLEESGIVAGMSGSPVYIDGKLIGALSAGWGFAKTPIGTVTPIESMLEVLPKPKGASSASAPARGSASLASFARSFGETLSAAEEVRLAFLESEFGKLGPPARVRSSRSLLAAAVSGLSTDSLDRFREPLARLGLDGLAAVAGLAGTGTGAREPPAGPLQGGSSITALLVDGDFQLGATGTVTFVEADGRFVAFGHPFLSFGDLDLPVAAARIVTVVPSLYQSFKVGYPGRPAYRLVSDRETAVGGRSGETAPLVPVRFRLETEAGEVKTLSWSVASHPKLLPALIGLSTDAALGASDPTPRERTFRYRVALETAAGPIVYEDVASGPKAHDIAVLTAATLAGLVADNEFEEPRISGIDLSFRAGSGERRLRLVDAALASNRVAPGETLAATVRLLDRRGGETTRVVRLRVPKETPEGKASLVIGDGSNASALRLALAPAEPRSLAGFRRWLERLLPSDRLVALLVIPSRGIATGTDTFTALPPSTATLLAGNPEPGDIRSDVAARLVAEEVLTLDRPLSGSIRLDFDVERPRS